MRVFVTGATGFVGTAVVKELLSAGHQVLGLARSNEKAEQLRTQGAEYLIGTIEDLEILKQGASQCEAVIHLAFNANFSDFAGSCATDRAAISALGSTLAAADGDRAFVITSGTMVLVEDDLADEDEKPRMTNPMAALRGPSEALCLDFAKQGVRTSVVRLPPTTHGPGISGFTGPLVMTAVEKGISAYVGDGENRWAAGHRDDAARIYRLAMEKAEPGSVFHAVGEEGVTVKEIATEIGNKLGIPVVSIGPEKLEEHFGWFAFGPMANNPASSKKTQERLDWTPNSPTVLEDVPRVIEFVKSQAPGAQ